MTDKDSYRSKIGHKPLILLKIIPLSELFNIYELRAKHRNVQYRIFYYFEGQNIVVLSHAIVKKTSAVPKKDIDLAIKRKEKFERDPKQHTYVEK